MVKRGRNFVSPNQRPNQASMESLPDSERPPFQNPLLTPRINVVVQFSPHSKEPIFKSPKGLVFGRFEPHTAIGQNRRQGKSQEEEGEGQRSQDSFHFVSPPFLSHIKIYHIFLGTLAGWLLAGCAVSTDLGFGKPRAVPPEFRQKVGLYAHDKPERFYYPGTVTLDVSDLMAFHLQQVLPFTAQGALQEIFSEVEVKEPGPKIQFKNPDLAGYFEIKITSARYDFPDPDLPNYRSDIELLVEFKTLQGEVMWRGGFKGEGIGFSNPSVRLTRFGREAASALEEAFQDAVSKMQEAVLTSPSLRDYFRWRLAEKANNVNE